MPLRNAIISFAEQHSFDASALLTEELDAIQCAVDCREAVHDGYAHLPSAVIEQDPSVGFVLQLYERCTERAYGALVAMATAGAASSEILSRATVEATVTIRYILRDRNVRLASFFQNHIDQAERQEKEWRKVTHRVEGAQRSTYSDACDYRLQGIAAAKKYVEMINSQLVPSGPIPAWPTIASRFSAVGDDIAYRTFYARLCAEAHFDAEETLRYFVGTMMTPQLLEAMAVETVMFSRFLLADATRGYAEAGKEFATVYEMASAVETCSAAEHMMHRHVLSLSAHIGGRP